MASPSRFVLSRLTGGRILAFMYANAGMLALTLTIASAGVLAFYVVAVPPGTVAYP